jgi:hypothetical protein
MRVIGLGNAGCKLAKAFSKFPQYEAIGIDVHKDATITIKKRDSHEEYDTHFPNLKKKLRFSNEDVLVVTAGSGQISGGILRLLEQLKNNRVSLLYIQSDLSLISEVQKRQDKIVKNILQEYARSGLLEMIYLIDDLRVQQSIGEMSIIGYYDTINQAIVNTLHMVNIFKHSEPIIGNFINPSEISRIATFGVANLDEDGAQENWFYPLTNVRDMVYYYGINEEDLKNDGTLFRKITDFVKSKATSGVSVSYGIYQTTYDQKYCYCIQYSSVVQSYTELIDD